MQLYVVRRYGGWRTHDEVEDAGERAEEVASGEMKNEVRWIRTYVLEEGEGAIGLMCIYEATGPEAIRRHAERARLPANEIYPVADTLVVRPDPVPAAAA
jgi:hypothetical protein